MLDANAMPRAAAIALAIVLGVAVLPAAIATAETAATYDAPPPDDLRAGMCDAFDGLAFTFCVALCEARSCDLLPSDDDRCVILRRGFARVSGGATAPCLADAATTSL